MINIKQIGWIIILFIAPFAMAQETVCDDFTADPWPTEYTTYSEGDLVGYSQEGTQPITVGTLSNCSFGGPSSMGIEVWNKLNFAFDGSNQLAQFEIFGIMGQYGEMGFTVNGSDVHYMNEVFPLIVEGVTIDLDDSAEDFDSWDNAYLIFTGEIDEIDIIGFESGINTLCVEPLFEESDCDDFTDMELYPEGSYSAGDIVGYSQGETQAITVAPTGMVWLNNSDPGVYGVGPVDFAFDGTNQSARFEVYGFLGQFGEMGFSVNGSPTVYLDGTFPMTVDGIEVDIDLSVPNVGDWEYFYLTFTGEIDEIEHVLFESGITELCIEEVVDIVEGCDDFTDMELYPEGSYSAGDIVGYSQGETQEITVAPTGMVWLNGSEPGIYGVGPVDFSFDGTNQSARFEVYGFLGQFGEMGFKVNESSTIYLDDTFPMTVDGIEVSIDLSVPNVGDWEYFYLTFEGEIDVVQHLLFESGVTELCVEELEEIDDTGIHDSEVKTLSIYPNPAQNQLTISDAANLTQLQIYSISGEMVFSTSRISSASIDISALETGIYVIKAQFQDGTQGVQKLIKE